MTAPRTTRCKGRGRERAGPLSYLAIRDFTELHAATIATAMPTGTSIARVLDLGPTPIPYVAIGCCSPAPRLGELAGRGHSAGTAVLRYAEERPGVDDWRVDRDDDRPPIDIEVLVAEPTGDAGDVGRPIRRWLPRVLAGVLAGAVVATVVVRANNEPSAAHATHPLVGAQASSEESDVSARPSSAVSPTPPVVVTEVAHPLLGVTGRWEFVRPGR